MNQKIMLFLFIKISTFILLTWIYDFYSEQSTFNKIINKNYNLSKKLDTRNYRLLARYKLNNHSYNVCLKKKLEDNEANKQRYLSNNGRRIKEKNKQSSRNLLNKAQYYVDVIDYNNGIFDGKHFHFKKKWIKKKDYDTFFEKKRRICDVALKKIKFKNYGYIVGMFFFFFFLGIGLPMLCKFEKVRAGARVSEVNFIDEKIIKYISSLLGTNNEFHVFILLYTVAFIILVVLIIIATYKILRNNEKYQKLKLMRE
ncbi:fam-m protein [Plasmodium malariae]|uniref:Fam-m protein n=1 Tax=Plasmodium malariae TaxID=5858 RepID=A0A1D3JI59_PLAMA|nr:fam-m protein [Plasmodium malariae]SBT85956.1 fam-m protein [Plasmodium malariae]